MYRLLKWGMNSPSSECSIVTTHANARNLIRREQHSTVDGATTWGPGSGDNWLAAAEERAEELLEEAAARAAAADLDIETDSTVGQPARTIVE